MAAGDVVDYAYVKEAREQQEGGQGGRVARVMKEVQRLAQMGQEGGAGLEEMGFDGFVRVDEDNAHCLKVSQPVSQGEGVVWRRRQGGWLAG